MLTFENRHSGETAYILGSGPTVKFFEEVTDDYKGLYIGVNHIYDLPNIGKKLDYLLIEKPHGRGCTPLHKVDTVLEDSLNELDITIFHCKRLNLTKQNCIPYRKHDDIKQIFQKYHMGASSSFGGVSCTIFHAFFFALFAGCTRIYLVGCDSSSTSKFYDVSRPTNYEIVKEGWARIQQMMVNKLPDIEVININPVNLYGVFPSIYTPNFAKDLEA